MHTAFSQFKIVTLEVTKADAIGFFESVALAGLEGEWFRLSADQQRQFFGNVPFGRRALMVAKDGLVSVIRSVAFGCDWDEQRGRWNAFEKCWCCAFDWRAFPKNEFPR